MIIIFFENTVKHTLENPGKEFYFTVGQPVKFLYFIDVINCRIQINSNIGLLRMMADFEILSQYRKNVVLADSQSG